MYKNWFSVYLSGRRYPAQIHYNHFDMPFGTTKKIIVFYDHMKIVV